MRPLRYLSWYLLAGWTYVGLIIWVSLTARLPEAPAIAHIDKLEHVGAYFLLMAWFGQVLSDERGRLVRALGFIAMGAALEVLQGMGGVRQMELMDAVANGAGVLVGLALSSGQGGRLLEKIEARTRK